MKPKVGYRHGVSYFYASNFSPSGVWPRTTDEKSRNFVNALRDKAAPVKTWVDAVTALPNTNQDYITVPDAKAVPTA